MKHVIKRILSKFPTDLPVGLTEFNKWADSIIELSGEYADRDSMRFAIASQVIHLPHTVSSKPKDYFVRAMRKAAANQIASAVFQEIKLAQQKEQEEVKKLAEVTADQSVTENGKE
jgi:hypothetical protein